MKSKYKYIIRQTDTYGSSLLIFLDMPDNKFFITKIIQAFSEINFQLTKTQDLFLSDELAIKAISDSGDFTLFRDNEDFYSILGNTTAISDLDKILKVHPEFLKAV